MQREWLVIRSLTDKNRIDGSGGHLARAADGAKSRSPDFALKRHLRDLCHMRPANGLPATLSSSGPTGLKVGVDERRVDEPLSLQSPVRVVFLLVLSCASVASDVYAVPRSCLDDDLVMQLDYARKPHFEVISRELMETVKGANCMVISTGSNTRLCTGEAGFINSHNPQSQLISNLTTIYLELILHRRWSRIIIMIETFSSHNLYREQDLSHSSSSASKPPTTRHPTARRRSITRCSSHSAISRIPSRCIRRRRRHHGGIRPRVRREVMVAIVHLGNPRPLSSGGGAATIITAMIVWS